MAVKAKQQIMKTFAVAAVLIAIAAGCRYVIISFENLPPFADKLLNYMRIFIYIGLFSIWGITLGRRVIQRPVRRMLIAIAALMVLWLIIREFRFRYISQPDFSRFLWYLYYIPLLIIPLLALYIAAFLGKGDGYRLPKKMWLFCLPTGLFLILILTNDLHQFAFRFPADVPIWSDAAYRYGWLYYTVTVWAYFCSFSAFAVMIKKLRIPQNKRKSLLPVLFGLAAIIYGVLYAVRIPFILRWFGDITVVFCLVFAGFFESCIDCGLIQSNSRYSDLFTASVNTPVQILDKDFHICFAAGASEKTDVKDVCRALEQPCIIHGGKRLHTIPVKGGYAVWTEDISELLRLREALTERKEELNERNAFLQLEYQKEAEYNTIAEQNRLYDLLQSKTQAQLDKIHACVQAYQAAPNKNEQKNILARIVIFGTFIKRRKDFVLSMENADSFPEIMLSNALAESYQALALLGIKGGYYIDTHREYLPGRIITTAYDFFEDVTEAVLDKANFINLRLSEAGGFLRVNILTDVSAQFPRLLEKYPALSLYDDDGTAFVLVLEGGDGGD